MLLVLLLSLIIPSIVLHLSFRSRKLRLPPGPRGWPIIGNLFDMPRETVWLTFAEWGKTHGDICSVTVFGRPIIILNTVAAAESMLNDKGNIYSDRPELPMGGELIGWKNTLPLVRYGDTFHEYRKLFHQLFGTHASMEAFYEFEAQSVRKFLRHVSSSPEELVKNLKTHIGTVTLGITYGYDVTQDGDHFVHLLDHGMSQFAVATAPGAFLVDLLPSLRHIPAWFPGGGFHHKAQEWAKSLHDMATIPYEYGKRQWAAGTEKHCFLSTVLSPGMSSQEEHVIKWTASTISAGGFSTRLSFLQAFFLMMSLHPEVQRRAQTEIELVIGLERFPTHSDREKLPYVNAVCREVFRFHSVVPTGLPHMVMEDDIHREFFIPKGSLIIANIWNMLHDPSMYADPHTFNPSRFLPHEGRSAERDVYDFIFGFGRRPCPGRILADTSLFIMAAMSLAVLNISRFVDQGGNLIEPPFKPLSGSVSQPHPFRCLINIRSPEALALLYLPDNNTLS